MVIQRLFIYLSQCLFNLTGRIKLVKQAVAEFVAQ